MSRAISIVILVTAAPVYAATIHVPADYPTIQQAIDAAQTGDEVVVANGTYQGPGNRDLDLGGKDIMVRSASGDPTTCIIDCEGMGRAFFFHNHETAAAVVDGLTIRNGYVRDDSQGGCAGGGLYLRNSSPTITNNIITQNSTGDFYGKGGGIYLYSSSPTIAGNVIQGNSADFGGGLWLRSSSAIVANNMILDNVADLYGGGLHQYGSSPTYVDNTISGNRAIQWDGGGLHVTAGSPVVWGNTITGNIATGSVGLGRGGGICFHNSFGFFMDNAIIGNRAELGAGLYLQDSEPEIVNTVVAGNTTKNYGGGLCLRRSSARIMNTTICANTGNYNGGLYLDDSTPILMNTIVAFNASGILAVGGIPLLRNCCVYGNSAYNFSGMSDPTETNGNVSVHPWFVRNPHDGGDGWGDDPSTPGVDEGANDDFGDLRLRPGSPCIDAGYDLGLPSDQFDLDGDGNRNERWPLDADGLARFVDDPATPDTGSGTPPIVDMGPYEFQVTAVPGDLDGDGDVDADDFTVFRAAFGRCEGDAAFVLEADYDDDGCVTLVDYQIWLTYYRAYEDRTAFPPAATPMETRYDARPGAALNVERLDAAEAIDHRLPVSGR